MPSKVRQRAREPPSVLLASKGLGIIRDAELCLLFRPRNKRHTCAAWLVQAGVSLAKVRDVLGHSTVMMTERYAHLAPENARSALAAIEGGESRFSHAGVSTTGGEIA